MTRELTVFLDVHLIGTLRRDARGRVSFVYERAWQNARHAYPLSLSMPLQQREHGHTVVDAFLWGLLPDNALILERWAKRFRVSPSNAFALLENVGEDCAGAVRFSADRDDPDTHGNVLWLSEEDVARRLRTLKRDISAWRDPDDGGQFSLGGAQPKIALLSQSGRWGIPGGRLATTHILKPGIADLEGHAENEHLCLELARALGIATAPSRVVRFDDEVAIVVERYDRRRAGGDLVRIHQEDACQSLAMHPAHKYESEGGPGARAIVELLRHNSTSPKEDVARFVDALILNWLLAGTDAHAKNYSILLATRGVRLAPLYDVASVLPYAKARERKLKLAMKIGGKYRLHEIGAHAWAKLAKEVGIDNEALRSRIVDLATTLPDRLADVIKHARQDGLKHPILATLEVALRKRVTECGTALRRSDEQ